MGRFRKYSLAISECDQEIVDEILERYYEQGDIDSVTVESSYDSGKLLIRLWLECSEDDFIAIRNEMTERGVTF